MRASSVSFADADSQISTAESVLDSGPADESDAMPSPVVATTPDLIADKKRKGTRMRTRSSRAAAVTFVPKTVSDDVVRLAATAALAQLGDDIDESALMLDLGQVTKKYEEWTTHLSRVRPHYAVKCNPDKNILKLLREQGAGFDCATMNEIHLALSIGAAPSDIVFSHPCKPRSHIRYAKEKGVRLMSFDNAVELRKVAIEFKEARLLLRLVCEDAHAQCPMSMKFGAARDEWPALVGLAAELGLQLSGVSFHVGSGCKEPGAFERALSDAREVFALGAEKGFYMEVLDIGGGFPGVDTDEVSFGSIAKVIDVQLDELFSKSAFPGLRVIAEPGRFFVCAAGALLTKVIAKACVSAPVAEGGNTECSALATTFRYYLNDGLYGSFNCVLYDHAEVVPETCKDSADLELHKCCIFGPTCDGFDMIIKEINFPELQEGDWLLWRDMGAYTSAAGSRFNGFPLARTWYYAEEGVLKGRFRSRTSERVCA